MANRRMLCKSISISEQANDLDDFTALLFSWMIPHADDYGILPGSPRKVKALVIPLRERTADDVEKAIITMVNAGLIWWYQINGEQYIQFRTWEKHQEGLHKRSKAKLPLYPGKEADIYKPSETFPEVPGNSRSIELNLTELNLTEENIIVPENFGPEIPPSPPELPPEPPKPPKRPKYTYTSEHLILANSLKSCILANNQNAKVPKVPEEWANEIRLMIEQDKRDPNAIVEIIEWCQKHSFWKTVILSGDKLRRKYDQMVLQKREAENEKHRGNNSTVRHSGDASKWDKATGW